MLSKLKTFRLTHGLLKTSSIKHWIKDRFPLGEMNGDLRIRMAINGQCVCALTFICFICCLAGETFLFKIVKMNLTNSPLKKSPHLLGQLKPE